MGMEFTRRSFMKGAGTAAGVMVAAGYSPFSYAQNEMIRLAVIGTGGQGNIHIRGGLAGVPDIEIVAVCDIYAPHQQAGQAYAWSSNAKIVDFDGWNDPPSIPRELRQKIQRARKPNAYYDYREMLDKEEIDAVLIATPLDTHYQITMDCLDAGKWVFCEKTMCYEIEQARNVVKKCHETGKFVQVGHQRRYNPEYNLAMMLARADRSAIGRIHHIDMQWHRNHNWRRFVDPNYQMNEQEQKFILQYSKDFETHMNWRIYEEKSMGLCTELLPHQADISNWFLGKMPSRIYATGGLDYWRDGRTTEDNISVVMEYEMSRGDAGYRPISARSAYQVMRDINRTYTVRVVYSSIMANAKRGASEMILGDDGAFELTERYGCVLSREAHAYPKPAPKPETPGEGPAEPVAEAPTQKTAEEEAAMVTSGGSVGVSTEATDKGERLIAGGMELTPHMYQFRDFTRKIKEGGKPRTNEMCGLSSTIVSVLAFQALRENRIIEVDENLMKFDFETPEWNEYGPLQA